MKAFDWLNHFMEACAQSCAKQHITFHRKLDPIPSDLMLDSTWWISGLPKS